MSRLKSIILGVGLVCVEPQEGVLCGTCLVRALLALMQMR